MTRFNNYLGRFQIIFSKLAFIKNCYNLLSERAIQLERCSVTLPSISGSINLGLAPISDEELGIRSKQTIYNLKVRLWLKFSGKLFASESMCQEKYQLVFKYCPLKKCKKDPCSGIMQQKSNSLKEVNLSRFINHIIDIAKFRWQYRWIYW